MHEWKLKVYFLEFSSVYSGFYMFFIIKYEKKLGIKYVFFISLENNA
jgi:hypothetical protein